jgi:hypothetical protein
MSNIRVFKSDMNEYLHSQSLGYAVRTRVEYSVNNGLLVYSKELGDYMFTKKAMKYANFFQWLQGNEDNLEEYPNY